MKYAAILLALIPLCNYSLSQNDSTGGAMLGNFRADTLAVPDLNDVFLIDEEAESMSVEDLPNDEHGFDTLGYPGIDEVILVDEEPVPLNMRDIKEFIGYPEIAREANIEGLVVVRVLVDSTGKFIKQKVLKSAHPVLKYAVIKHTPKLMFTPAILNGEDVAFWANIPFHFKLLGPGRRKKKRSN